MLKCLSRNSLRPNDKPEFASNPLRSFLPSKVLPPSPRLLHEADALPGQPHTHQDTEANPFGSTSETSNHFTGVLLLFSCMMNKAELYKLYITLQSASFSPRSNTAPKTANRASKAYKAQNFPFSTPPSFRSRSDPPRVSGRSGRHSANPGHAATRPRSPLASVLPLSTAVLATAPPAIGLLALSQPLNLFLPPLTNLCFSNGKSFTGLSGLHKPHPLPVADSYSS
ncbi:hypothetical protein Q8A67_008130 [Cirrhinus molitorella]|uniref:Uncharacterized protein n=1 Tax=Cirrhinus molitorella TaxID=172907 RepID=A0AA88U0Y3_9TELE|nr:hypothetical protein Q8A67_008130 [Cirrhinus molitorella]